MPSAETQRDAKHRNLRLISQGWGIPGKSSSSGGWRVVSEKRGISWGWRVTSYVGCLGPGEEVRLSSETKGK